MRAKFRPTLRGAGSRGLRARPWAWSTSDAAAPVVVQLSRACRAQARYGPAAPARASVQLGAAALAAGLCYRVGWAAGHGHAGERQHEHRRGLGGDAVAVMQPRIGRAGEDV